MENARHKTTSTGTHKGGRVVIPKLDASTPVMNGSTAEPAWPAPAMYPAQAERSQRGRMVVEWLIRIGNTGPRKIPTSETATAFPTREGTTQTVASRLDRRRMDTGQRRNRSHGPPETYPITRAT